VDAPDPGEALGAEARDYTKELVGGRAVRINVIGATNGPVIFGDILLPNEGTLGLGLLTEGLARWNHTQSADPKLGAAEVEARCRRRGVWIGDLPVVGALFRQGGSASGRAAGSVGSEGLDRLTQEIMRLSDGDRARLAQRLGGVLPMQGGGVGQTTLIIRETTPVYVDSPYRGDRTRPRPESETLGQRRPGATWGSGSGQSEPSGGMVYADGRGGFHRLSCFGGGQPGPAMSRSEALGRGYAPCPQCRP
jgi:hypothetical protein